MQGLLDFLKTPAGQGLLSGAFGWAAGARRGTPWNNLGRGGLAGLAGYSNAIEGQRADEEAQFTKQYRKLQMDNYRAEMDERKRKQEEDAAKKAGLQNFIQAVDPTRAALSDGRGPTLQNAGRLPDQRSAMYFEMLRNGLISAPDYLSAVGPKDPKVKDYKEVRNADGSVSYVGLTEDGKVIDTKQTPFKAPEVRDFGGYVGGVDPITGKVSKFGDKTIDPGTRASNAVAWANNAVARDRLNFDMTGGVEGGVTQAGSNRLFGKPPAGYRWKQDGGLEVIPGGPADQKALNQDAGRQSVSQIIAQLSSYYTDLEKGGGITSTDQNIGSNIGAWAGSTGVGQTVGSMLGTKNQSARDAIEQTRPLLMQAIMKATGMSAKQMDSNAELKMYLATATDPTKSLQANRAALQRLEEMFGMGAGSLGSGGGSAPKQNQTPARVPKVGEVVDGYMFLGGNPADRTSWKDVR